MSDFPLPEKLGLPLRFHVEEDGQDQEERPFAIDQIDNPEVKRDCWFVRKRVIIQYTI